METFLKIENIKLWARVGVLEEERELGQLFILDIFLWTGLQMGLDMDSELKSGYLLKLFHQGDLWV